MYSHRKFLDVMTFTSGKVRGKMVFNNNRVHIIQKGCRNGKLLRCDVIIIRKINRKAIVTKGRVNESHWWVTGILSTIQAL